MRDPLKRSLVWAVFGVCLLAATTFTRAQNQSNPASGEPIELFAKLMPVFTHPRCANCHGGVDPFNEYKGPPAVEHGGGVIGEPTDSMDERNEECGGCHNETERIANSWVLASQIKPDRNFVGKSTQQMCEEQAFEVINMPKHTSRSWPEHLEVDVLITQSFDGRAGGQRSPADPPPMKRDDFLKAARAWVAAGAGCTWVGTIKQTENFTANYGFPGPGSTAATTVQESANRTLMIERDPGVTTAKIAMAGNKDMTTVDRSACTTTVKLLADWGNGNASKKAPASVWFEIAADGSYLIHFTGPPEKTHGTDDTIMTSTCGALPSFPQSTVELDWDAWQFNIRCPATPAINSARGESIECDLFDRDKWPRLKGKMTRVVQDMWDAADRQSWLAVSPVSTGRADTGESLPVTVVTEWDFELDQLSPDAKALRQ